MKTCDRCIKRKEALHWLTVDSSDRVDGGAVSPLHMELCISCAREFDHWFKLWRVEAIK